MQDQPFQTSKNQRVRLRSEGQDNLYALAHAGSPGWVRKQKHDKLGYPQVFIEWDKDHWSYNGEPDKWAMEAHFEPDKDTQMSEEFKMPDDPRQFADLLANFQKFMEAQKQSDPEPSEPDEDQVRADYQTSLTAVGERLRNGEAYIAIVVDRQDGEEAPILTPRIASFYVTPEAGLLAEMQLSKLAAISHEESIVDRMRELVTPPSDE